MRVSYDTEITVISTESEWKELSTALIDNRIDWPVDVNGSRKPYVWDRHIEITTWDMDCPKLDYMDVLSENYPSVIFCLQILADGFEKLSSEWLCNGKLISKSNIDCTRKNSYQTAVQRAVRETNLSAGGVEHLVEIMPDGRVAADGENRFGECNVLLWTGIKQVSCGDHHTVGLTDNGTVVACGSNANGQCEVRDLPEPAIQVSCGRYHTAILLQSGRVLLRGNLEQSALSQNDEQMRQIMSHDFSKEFTLNQPRAAQRLTSSNERIEHIRPGDPLRLKAHSTQTESCFIVYNQKNQSLGSIEASNPIVQNALNELLPQITACAGEVTPLSQRRKGSKYSNMTVLLNYKAPPKTRWTNTLYSETPVESWPPVKKIKCVLDAVVGVTADHKLLVDGFCPCTEAELMKLMKLTQ